jgi:hypothetical protein
MRPNRPLDAKSRFERCTAAEEIDLTNRVSHKMRAPFGC